MGWSRWTLLLELLLPVFSGLDVLARAQFSRKHLHSRGRLQMRLASKLNAPRAERSVRRLDTPQLHWSRACGTTQFFFLLVDGRCICAHTEDVSN